MFRNVICTKCGRELTGAIEKTTMNVGTYVLIVQRETWDCNWAVCSVCGQVMCKSCRTKKAVHCSSTRRVVVLETARAALTVGKRTQNTTE